jgi:hypothetical protein
LIAKLVPPALDPRTLGILRELDRIYIHFHDATLQSFEVEDKVIECVDRMITPAPPEFGISIRPRVEMGIRIAAANLDQAGGHTRD